MDTKRKRVKMSFGAETTATEVLDGKDLSGKIAVITGCSGGIGLETARTLASAGAEIIMANRKSEKSQNAYNQLQADLPDADITPMELDLGSLASVRKFTDQYQENFSELNLLINNAGVMACPQDYTEDGFEIQFGTNHLGHFVLTCRLVPLLLASAPARVVNLSSGGHRRANVDLEDPNFKNRSYDKWESYGQSKTANILFALELNRRLSDRGVLAFSVHPGMIPTDLSRHMTKEDIDQLLKRTSSMGESGMKPKQVGAGAATSVWAATAEELEAQGGKYLEDCGVSRPNEGETDPFGYLPYAVDTDLAQKLWELSETLVDEKFDLS